MTEELQKDSLRKQTYHPKDALLFRGEGGIVIAPYVGQEYDPEKAELKQAYWDHDYCELCSSILFESPDTKHGTGYTDGRTWICKECYDALIVENSLS